MRRSLLLLIGTIAITYVGFVYYPGHSYLAGESQTLVATMERLNAHGFLSRDLAATNPNLSATIFDEVSLFLNHATGHDFEWALGIQQVTFRFAGVLGVVLLGLAAGIKTLPSLGLAALVSAGAQLPGLHLPLTSPEPTPFTFALGLTLLAFGLLAHSKPLLSGLSGGIALAYEPSVAAVFWASVVAGLIFQPRLRTLLRPTLPALLVFSLLLANAAQLQPGQGEAQPFLERVAGSWMRIQLQRTPEIWMFTWSIRAFLFYFALGLMGAFALKRLWPKLTMPAQWMFLTLLTLGLGIVPILLLGLQVFRFALTGEVELTRTLALSTICVATLLAAFLSQAWKEARQWAASLGLVILLTAFLLLHESLPSIRERRERQSIQSISQWAELNTWGGSMFLFPDAGKSTAPGEFRARAVRAVYVDWTSGALVKTFPVFGTEWARRWREAGGESYSVTDLQKLLSLPVEYVVLRRRNALQDVTSEFSTPEFVVYDAQALRVASRPFRSWNGS